MKKIVTFLKEVQVEFKHVRWPSKEELFGLTTAVISFGLILTIIIGVYDFLFAKLVSIIP